MSGKREIASLLRIHLFLSFSQYFHGEIFSTKKAKNRAKYFVKKNSKKMIFGLF